MERITAVFCNAKNTLSKKQTQFYVPAVYHLINTVFKKESMTVV